ncbi:MAG: outer membrane beta-barrel protein [Rikenellaceae bacterium]
MKKVLLFIAVAICSISAASAQMTQGDSSIAAKIGFGGGWGVPISVTYENALWGINDNSCVTIGGNLSYAGKSYTGFKTTYVFVGARGTYHYAINKWDLFGGVTLGYDIASVKWTDEDLKALGGASASSFDFRFNIGANYYITEKFAVGAEYGYGLSPINIGVTYKF